MGEMSSIYSENIGLESIVQLIGTQLSTATVLFHQAVADRLGVNATDMKAYTVLTQAGTMTAGELAERLGLTSGAITSVIDRLEKAGLVRRALDPNDRRRVILELLRNPEREREIMQLYEPMGRAITALVSSYSAAERTTIIDFISRAITILESATLELRQKR